MGRRIRRRLVIFLTWQVRDIQTIVVLSKLAPAQKHIGNLTNGNISIAVFAGFLEGLAADEEALVGLHLLMDAVQVFKGDELGGGEGEEEDEEVRVSVV